MHLRPTGSPCERTAKGHQHREAWQQDNENAREVKQNSGVFHSKKSLLRHANIVQKVKICYKIKINSRESKSCFYGVLLCKQHPSLTIVPLLHSDSATIRV